MMIRFLERCMLAVGLCFVYLPLVYVVFAGFNDSQFMSSDFRGVTFRWLSSAFTNPRFHESILRTSAVALVVASVATVVALVLAIAYSLGRRSTQWLIFIGLLLLVATPPTSYCLNTVALLRHLGMSKGVIAVILGQIVQGLPFCCIIIILALQRVSFAEYEAAVVLGRQRVVAFFEFVLAKLWAPLTLSFVLAAYISLDDLVASVYLSEPSSAPPITELIWQSMRNDLSPVIAWHALTLSLLGAILVGFLGFFAKSRRQTADEEHSSSTT